MDNIEFIAGLMRQNTDALGFIPYSGLSRYVGLGNYLIQCHRGNPIGYMLHGTKKPGAILTIAQACIEYDFRQNGYGSDIVRQLTERAQISNCKAISLHCASDLTANEFWKAQGFRLINVSHPHNRRRRSINVWWMSLYPSFHDIWDQGVGE